MSGAHALLSASPYVNVAPAADRPGKRRAGCGSNSSAEPRIAFAADASGMIGCLIPFPGEARSDGLGVAPDRPGVLPRFQRFIMPRPSIIIIIIIGICAMCSCIACCCRTSSFTTAAMAATFASPVAAFI